MRRLLPLCRRQHSCLRSRSNQDPAGAGGIGFLGDLRSSTMCCCQVAGMTVADPRAFRRCEISGYPLGGWLTA